MRQIRNNVFETNSSSVHTLCIDSSGREPSRFKINKKGQIVVDYGEFGKNLCYYNTQYDKLSYLVTLCYYLSGWDTEHVENSWTFEAIQEAICEYTGAKELKIKGKVEPSIDHQSQPYDDITIVNVYDKDSVIDFVFNKYITLKTDCD